jgi:hypothetical protein
MISHSRSALYFLPSDYCITRGFATKIYDLSVPFLFA